MSQTPSELREKADEKEAKAEAIEALRDEVLDADRIGDTRLSELFHEARTSRPDVWKSASAFVDVEDGEAVVRDVSKIREGRWSPETRDRYDAVVSVGVRAFMETSRFQSLVRDNLQQHIRGARSNAHELRQNADAIEQREQVNR